MITISTTNFKNGSKFFLSRMLPLALSVFLTCCASTNGIVSESDIHSLLKIVEKKAYIVGQFEAKFHKIRQSNLFNHEACVDGRLIFQKPGRFELKLTGDVNLQILSDGEFVALIHDNRDLEFFKADGERDVSRFADPMMLLVNCLSNGDTSRFAKMRQKQHDDSTVLEIDPGDLSEFEAIKDVKVKFSDQGTIQSIVMFFKNGNVEKTVFDSWSLLTQDDPKIQRMNNRIEKISAMADSNLLNGIYKLKPDEFFITDQTAKQPLTSKLESKKDSVSE